MVKLRIYLDTSVISAHVDARDPARQAQTHDFWKALSGFSPQISQWVVEEINETPSSEQRIAMNHLVCGIPLVAWDEKAEHLARLYVSECAFGPAMINDARHVAAAIAAGIPVLVSWNFRHLVNRARRLKINLVNAQFGFGQIEIIAPPELA